MSLTLLLLFAWLGCYRDVLTTCMTWWRNAGNGSETTGRWPTTSAVAFSSSLCKHLSPTETEMMTTRRMMLTAIFEFNYPLSFPDHFPCSFFFFSSPRLLCMLNSCHYEVIRFSNYYSVGSPARVHFILENIFYFVSVVRPWSQLASMLIWMHQWPSAGLMPSGFTYLNWCHTVVGSSLPGPLQFVSDPILSSSRMHVLLSATRLISAHTGVLVNPHSANNINQSRTFQELIFLYCLSLPVRWWAIVNHWIVVQFLAASRRPLPLFS